MKLSKLTLAVATVLGASLSASAFAIDLYVDTKTKQIFAEPGKRRVKMGSFEKVKQSSNESASDKSSLDAIRQDLELKENAIKALEEHIKEEKSGAAEVKMSDKGIEFESRDGNFKFAINGRLQVDAQVNTSNGTTPATGANTPNRLADGATIRRARLGVEGTFFKDFDYKFEYDFTRASSFNLPNNSAGTSTGSTSVAAGVTDAYIAWNISKPFSIKVGQFKEPFSMEEATSNRFLTFIERNQVVNSFSDNPNSYKVGLGVNYVQDQYGIMAAVMTENVGASWANNSTNSNVNGNRSNGSGDTSWDITARAFGRPWLEDKEHFLHVGASGSYRNVNNNYLANGTFNNGGMTFTATPNGNVDRTNILNTGNLSNATGSRIVDHFTRGGVETALVYGPFSAQAEYMRTDIYGKGYKDTSFDGYYAYASYFLTGESRNYKAKTGAWDRIKPGKNFNLSSGGLGAWEIAAGYDYLNLNGSTTANGAAGVVNGGRASTAKLAVNWYINSHVRVMANYIHVLDISTNTMGAVAARSPSFNNTNPDIFELRTQVDW